MPPTWSNSWLTQGSRRPSSSSRRRSRTTRSCGIGGCSRPKSIPSPATTTSPVCPSGPNASTGGSGSLRRLSASTTTKCWPRWAWRRASSSSCVTPGSSARRSTPDNVSRGSAARRVSARLTGLQNRRIGSKLGSSHGLPEADEALTIGPFEEVAHRRRQLDPTVGRRHVPGVPATLLEGHRTLVRGPDVGSDDEDPMVGQDADVRSVQSLDGRSCRVRIVDRSFVLVHQSDGAPAQARALVEDPGDAVQVGPDGAKTGVVVDGHPDVRTGPMEFEMQLCAGRHRPVAFHHPTLEVDADDVGGPELGPGQEPRVAQEGSVAEPDGDVPGQVIVIAFAPQGSSQEDQLLFQREIGKELVGSWYEVGHGRHVSGSGWRYMRAAFSWVRRRSSSVGRWPQ